MSAKILEPGQSQTFRRQVENLQGTILGLGLDTGHILGGQGAIDKGGRNAVGLKAVYLVLHQSDERGDHHGQAIKAHGRQLVTQGFSSRRWASPPGVFLAEHPPDDLLLQREESVKTEVGF